MSVYIYATHYIHVNQYIIMVSETLSRLDKWKCREYVGLTGIPYFLDWNARVQLVSSELLAGVVFEGAFYSRARSIPFSLSVTKIFSKHKKPWTISLHNHTILIHHKQNYFIQHTNVRFIH